MPHTYIAAIMDGRIEGADYSQWVNDRLAANGFTLEPNGALKKGEELIGFYAFLDREEGDTLLSADALARVNAPGPHRGAAVGYFAWTHVLEPQLAAQYLLPAIVAIGGGVVARTDDGRYKDTVGIIEFALSNLLGKYGFWDGDDLLSRDEAYLSYVQCEAKAALEAAGLSGEVGRFDSHHNPIRIVGDLRKDGRVLDESDEQTALDLHSMRIWARNPKVLEDVDFWCDD